MAKTIDLVLAEYVSAGTPAIALRTSEETRALIGHGLYVWIEGHRFQSDMPLRGFTWLGLNIGHL